MTRSSARALPTSALTHPGPAIASTAGRVRIVGLGGSVATPSSSRRALELALESASSAGAEVELLDLRSLRLPFYDPTIRHVPPAALRLAAVASQADGMIWSSPTYHGAMSGAFKNALDWLQLLAEDDPPYLTDRPVGLIATAGGSRAMQTVNTMASAAQGLRAWALPFCVTIATAHSAFAADGTPRDGVVAGQLATLGRSTVSAARRLAHGVRLLTMPELHDPGPAGDDAGDDAPDHERGARAGLRVPGGAAPMPPGAA